MSSGRHPLGIQPCGNYWIEPGETGRQEGLGDLVLLSDALLLKVLDELDAVSLGRIACASKAFRCFAYSEDLWKKLVFEEWRHDFHFKTSWRRSYVHMKNPTVELHEGKIESIQRFYSDLLFQPWFCAHLEIPPQWLEVDNIPRYSHSSSLEEFRRTFETPNTPVVLQGAMDNWKALKLWNRAYLSQSIGHQSVLVGNHPMHFQQYLHYSDSQEDESPLYLFDKQIFQKCPELAEHFSAPDIFPEDLFSCLEPRPDYRSVLVRGSTMEEVWPRWLIMGPERSGSSFHKDPNATAAWNAVIRGSKKWILFPPHILPPGVHQSLDGSEVATSISLTEWFLNFYPETQHPDQVKPVEGVVHEGELMFVPRGWWHLVMNLEETIAVTQNFVSSVNLPHVLGFLKSGNTSLVSGLPHEQRYSVAAYLLPSIQDSWLYRSGLYERFLAALTRHHPEILDVAGERISGEKRSRLTEAFTSKNKLQKAQSDQQEVEKSNAFKFRFF